MYVVEPYFQHSNMEYKLSNKQKQATFPAIKVLLAPDVEEHRMFIHTCKEIDSIDKCIYVQMLLFSTDNFFYDILAFAEARGHKHTYKYFKYLSDAQVLDNFMEDLDYLVESDMDPVPGITQVKAGGLTQQTLTFLDNQPTNVLDMGTVADDTRVHADNQDTNSLGAFLSRPVAINSIVWTPNTTFNGTGYSDIYIWQSLASFYLLKMSDFRMFRCTSLKLQIRINGSPFHYGRLRVSYIPGRYQNPYSGQNSPINTTLQPTNMGAFNASNEPLKTHWSQYPGVFVDPNTNEVVEFDIPFFWPNDYLSLTAGSVLTNNLEDMGTLKVWELTPLQHSNGAVTDSINISIVAWFVDPVVTMPTVVPMYGGEADMSNAKPVAHKVRKNRAKVIKSGASNGDEYGKGVISSKATALERFMGSLEKVPYIGPYATATKIASGAVATVAKMFGFSRPVLLQNQTQVTQRPFGSLAVVEGEEPAVKLTLDPKQEVTIDPSVVGLSPIDEMSMAYLCGRESLIVQIPWTHSDTGIIANIAIHPQVCPQHLSTNLVRWDTALSWATYPFLYWRGSLKYRFQIVASAMHRGRLAISYQPVKNADASQPNPLYAYTQYVDLTECRDFTFVVNYTHYSPWLRMHLPNPTLIGTGAPSFNSVISGQTNGVMTVAVVNRLGAPIATSDISINVFISAGDDFMVAAPGATLFDGLTPFSTFLRDQYTAESYFAQADMDPTVPNENTAMSLSPISTLNGSIDNVDADLEQLVSFGEQCVSVRSLLRRYCAYRNIIWDTNTSFSAGVGITLRNTTLPVYRGPSGSPENNAGNWDIGYSDSSGPYNFVNTTLLNWYRFGYAAWRGSIRYKYISDKMASMQTSGALYVHREPTIATSSSLLFGQAYINSIAGTQTQTMAQRLATALPQLHTHTFAGTDVNYIRQKNGIEFEMPYYFNQRFMWNKQPAPTNINVADPNDSYYQQHASTASSVFMVDTVVNANELSGANIASLWVATGEDFGLHYFMAAPILGFSEPTMA